MEEIIRNIQVSIFRIFSFLKREWIGVLFVTLLVHCVFYFAAWMSRDRYSNDHNKGFYATIFTSMSHSSDSREDFYKSYEKDFVKENQNTIDSGLERWVDAKMVKLGYVKYKEFFYKEGIKIYYNELPKNK